MSGGWAPLFPSLTTGTLCGRWPDIGLWPIVLSLKDRNGIVDVTPDYLSRVTGLEIEAVVACMARFCEPDPYSRSGAEEGRRLVLIDPERRNWGWRVVNSGLYRERARLQAKDEARTESGADAQRKREKRSLEDRSRLDDASSPEVPRSPPDVGKSPEVPLSYAESESVRKEQHRKRGADTRGCRIPIPFAISEEMRSWARAETPGIDVDRATAEFVDYWCGVSGQKGCKLDWVATWRNRLREVHSRKSARSKPQERSEWM
jgi:hypothetical protein